MIKLLPATCQTEIVTVEGKPVTIAEILSEGKGQSSGIILIQGGEAFYLTSNAEDLKTTLTNLATVLTTIGNALTSIGTMMTGPTTAPPPTLPTAVSDITSVVTQLNTLKAQLK